MYSRSAKSLANLLGAKRIKKDSKYRFRKGDIIVSLGNNNPPDWGDRISGTDILNKWDNLAVAQNKLTCLQVLEKNGIAVPNFTSDKERAKSFFTGKNSKVVCRTLLNASEGRGIVIAESPDELVDASLYTKYFPKKHEYRVHVFNNEVIDVTQKRLLNSEDRPAERNPYIRNLKNGWIYARTNVTLPEAVKEACIKACNVLKLNFGAVDCAVNKEGAFVIFEINTAPGLEGTTLVKYKEALIKYIKQKEENVFQNNSSSS